MNCVIKQAQLLTDYKSEANIDYQKCYTFKVNEAKNELTSLIKYLDKKTNFL